MDFLADRVFGEVPGRIAARVGELLAQMDSDAPEEREEATRELTRPGLPALPAIRKALAGHLSPEVRVRLQYVLTGMRGQEETCIRVLQAVGGERAREVPGRLSR